MTLIDNTHEFYRPLWRRIAIVATTLIWTGVEVFYARDGFWGVIAAGVAALSIWSFLITYQEPPPKNEGK